ncbi:MAG: tetratricopeptide repeat protein [Candidatus Micrarchaeota archaeon]|nr:tetratricopeptide repeat protein [Candidatus Micrarchaeota archaeon]
MAALAASLAQIRKHIDEGNKSFDRGDFRDSKSHFSKAIAALDKTAPGGLDVLRADAYNGMGHTLRSLGEFDRSLDFQKRALSLYRQISRHYESQFRPKLAKALHFTADVLYDVGKKNESLAHYREELGIARKLYAENSKKHLKIMVYALNGTAIRLADTKGDFRGALAYINESLRLQRVAFRTSKEERKNYPNMSWSHNIKGITLLKKGDADGAIKELEAALEMRRIIARQNPRYTAALAGTLSWLSEAYCAKAEGRHSKLLRRVS